MNVLDYNLPSSKNGGKITSFNYSRSLNELVSNWSAEVAGGTFKAGASINFGNVLTDGIITNCYKDASGLWHIEGRDAGVKLMKSTPEISELPTGNAKTVITYLANFCGISLVMNSNGLTGFNVRSVVTGSTCAEAILELAMLSGCVAFIDNQGRLNVSAPREKSSHLEFSNIIDDSGSDIDLDGYATQVLVQISRRNSQETEPEEDDDEPQEYYSGETPSLTPTRETNSGIITNGNYSVTTLEPFGVIEQSRSEITENGVTITTQEDHDYEYKSKVIWRDNQEYVLFAFCEKGYELTRTAEGSYSTANGESLSFKETTTETLTRTFSVRNAEIGIPEDWEDEIDFVSSETLTRSTVREGGQPPGENMPSYSPPFDSQVTRNFTRRNHGRGILCHETEISYEARQVGTIAPVKKDGQAIPHFLTGGNLAIQTHTSPEWVEVNKYRTYYEQYDEDGNCVISTRSEYSDDGSKWLISHALTNTGDEDLNEYEKAYAKFTQNSQGLEVSFNSSGINTFWQFIELPGRTKSTTPPDEEDTANLGTLSEWYDNGEYVPSYICPHYNESTKFCNVYNLVNMILSSPKSCPRRKGIDWKTCPRALEALKLVREQETSDIEPVIIGSASISNLTSKTPAVGYQREIYIDDVLSDETAQTIANTIARNILTVKGTKGLRKTVTIPYSPSYEPDGLIVEVSHDWENLRTSITYLEVGTIPECLISQSVSSIAAFVMKRESSKQNIPQYGEIVSSSSGEVIVRIGSSEIPCTTKLKNLGSGDIVLVSFASGNKLRGQVIARL